MQVEKTAAGKRSRRQARPLIAGASGQRLGASGLAGEPLRPAADWGRRRGRAAAEQAFKERGSGRIAGRVVRVVARKVDAGREVAGRPTVTRLRMRNKSFQVLASGILEQRDHRGVAA